MRYSSLALFSSGTSLIDLNPLDHLLCLPRAPPALFQPLAHAFFWLYLVLDLFVALVVSAVTVLFGTILSDDCLYWFFPFDSFYI